MDALYFAIACGVVALAYGVFAVRKVMSASAGTARMQEIAGAIQVGAQAYLNRQYLTIAICGAVIFVLLLVLLGIAQSVGFLVGAILSGAAGYIGMLVSVRANVRTAEAARTSLEKALGIAVSAGAVTGILVVGLGLLGVTVYYVVLLGMEIEQRTI
ncbi:MAG: sodium/proton-translocating pyrophosphatase, partial [Proteobacteria bacterium]|nr:sodium/proton-translocating pyrophosphatase [Pseudomonadota bacterium]